MAKAIITGGGPFAFADNPWLHEFVKRARQTKGTYKMASARVIRTKHLPRLNEQASYVPPANEPVHIVIDGWCAALMAFSH